MKPRRSVLVASIAAALTAWPATASSLGPPQEDRRKDLMDQLGLPKKSKSTPPADDDAAPPEDDDEGDAHDGAPDAKRPDDAPAPEPAAITYVGRCDACSIVVARVAMPRGPRRVTRSS